MGKLRLPQWSQRFGLALGFSFQIVSAIALAATWFGVSNIPLPVMAAAAEVIGMLVLARVIGDYRAEVAQLRRPDPDRLRLRLSTWLGGALVVWMRKGLTVAQRLEVSHAIVTVLAGSLGAGEAAAFLFAVQHAEVESYLIDLIRRCPHVAVAPTFDPSESETILSRLISSTPS
jgi:hypothetical protein